MNISKYTCKTTPVLRSLELSESLIDDKNFSKMFIDCLQKFHYLFWEGYAKTAVTALKVKS